MFLGRFVAFFRAVMPALAGTAGMRYRRFLGFNAAGGIVWGAGVVLLGYLAGTSYAAVERTVGRDVAFAVAGDRRRHPASSPVRADQHAIEPELRERRGVAQTCALASDQALLRARNTTGAPRQHSHGPNALASWRGRLHRMNEHLTLMRSLPRPRSSR